MDVFFSLKKSRGTKTKEGVRRRVSSLTITNYFSHPPLTLDVPLRPTLVINCSEDSNLSETTAHCLLFSPVPNPSSPPRLFSKYGPPLGKALLLSSTRTPQVFN